MRWLWYVGPVLVVLVYLWSALWPTRRDRWRKAELRRWVDDFLGPLPKARPDGPGSGARSGPHHSATGHPAPDESPYAERSVVRLPQAMHALVEQVGSGDVVGNVELVPKLAYLAVRAANLSSGSHHQTVVAKLAKPGPSLVVRPLPIVEGKPQENRGIVLDDPAFMEQFMVEGADAKLVGKWLSNAVREALLDLPGIWLRVDGRTMALSLYGEADADRLDELVATADALFAARGASGAPSLFGDESSEAARAATDAATKGGSGSKRRRQRAIAEPARPALASVGTRIGAAAIDLFLYLCSAAFVVGVLALREEGLSGLLGTASTDEFDGPWQGGWNTKGFGALVVAEAVLCGLFVVQTYFAARRGQSIGMRLLGARVVRLGGEAVEFFQGVVARTWLMAAVPLGVAAALARPFSSRTFLAHLGDSKVLIAVVAVAVVDALVMFLGSGQQCLHDVIARTKVVAVERDVFGLEQLRLRVRRASPDELGRKVDLWSILSVASIALGLGVVAIVPIVFAASAKQGLQQGDLHQAEKDIGVAQLLCLLGYAVVAIGVVLYATKALGPFSAAR